MPHKIIHKVDHRKYCDFILTSCLKQKIYFDLHFYCRRFEANVILSSINLISGMNCSQFRIFYFLFFFLSYARILSFHFITFLFQMRKLICCCLLVDDIIMNKILNWMCHKWVVCECACVWNNIISLNWVNEWQKNNKWIDSSVMFKCMKSCRYYWIV